MSVYRDELWKCIFPQYRLPLVVTPYFLVASQFDSFQLVKNIGHKPPFSDKEEEYAVEFAKITSSIVDKLQRTWRPSTLTGDVQIGASSPACFSHSISLTKEGFAMDYVGRYFATSTSMEKGLNEFLVQYANHNPPLIKPGNQRPSSPDHEKRLLWMDACHGFACGMIAFIDVAGIQSSVLPHSLRMCT